LAGGLVGGAGKFGWLRGVYTDGVALDDSSIVRMVRVMREVIEILAKGSLRG